MSTPRRFLAAAAASVLLGTGCSATVPLADTAPAPGRSAGATPAASPSTTPSAPGAVDIYAHTGVGDFSPQTRGVPYLLYVPQSAGTGVDVVDPVAMRVVGHYKTGLDPQHVVPSYDLTTLYATNTLANSLTPFDPRTGKPTGETISVDDPYNLYFTPGGKQAIVVAEARQRLDFYDAHTFALKHRLQVDCAGVDHADFTADGRFMLASCEFAGRMVRVDLSTETVTGYLDLPGSSPQDVRSSPDGRVFYVADMKLGGVHLVDPMTFAQIGFIPTGRDAHGLYPSRDGKRLFVSNRLGGSLSVIDFATRRRVATWQLPKGASPDMGGVSPDGKAIWLSGRYSGAIFKISTDDGRVLGQVAVPLKPHGMAVWPQPGRFSLGHTGNMR